MAWKKFGRQFRLKPRFMLRLRLELRLRPRLTLRLNFLFQIRKPAPLPRVFTAELARKQTTGASSVTA